MEAYTMVSNYYGTVHAYESDGKYYLALDDWGSTSKQEVSKEFFDAFVKEFGDKE